MLRRSLLALVLGGAAIGSSGCFIPIYSNQPAERVNELLNTSEDYRQIQAEWARIWFVDQPSHLTYDRIHGGVQ